MHPARTMASTHPSLMLWGWQTETLDFIHSVLSCKSHFACDCPPWFSLAAFTHLPLYTLHLVKIHSGGLKQPRVGWTQQVGASNCMLCILHCRVIPVHHGTCTVSLVAEKKRFPITLVAPTQPAVANTLRNCERILSTLAALGSTCCIGGQGCTQRILAFFVLGLWRVGKPCALFGRMQVLCLRVHRFERQHWVRRSSTVSLLKFLPLLVQLDGGPFFGSACLQMFVEATLPRATKLKITSSNSQTKQSVAVQKSLNAAQWKTTLLLP